MTTLQQVVEARVAAEKALAVASTALEAYRRASAEHERLWDAMCAECAAYAEECFAKDQYTDPYDA